MGADPGEISAQMIDRGMRMSQIIRRECGGCGFLMPELDYAAHKFQPTCPRCPPNRKAGWIAVYSDGSRIDPFGKVLTVPFNKEQGYAILQVRG